jgi:protein SCO1/2
MKDFAIGAILLVLAINLTACNSSSQPTVVVPSQVKAAKHYRLTGKVVSIEQRVKMVNVDSEAIPGFMDAMTMPYKVKPDSELDKLHPGDAITADLLVQDGGAWLENISITGHSAATGQNR